MSSELSYQKTAAILARLSTTADDVVLIGGQALNFWAEHYLSRSTGLAEFAPYSSKDIDLCGAPEAVSACAAKLGGRAVFPDPFSASPSTGKIIFHDSTGEEREIDVLGQPFGLTVREVIRTSLPVKIGYGGSDLSFRVMHPVLCMESRACNVAGLLGYRTPHGLRQLRAAVLCAAEFLRDLLERGRVRPVLKLNERIFKFAAHHFHGRKAHTFGADPFDAVVVDDRLGEFAAKRYPQMRVIIDRRRRSLARVMPPVA